MTRDELLALRAGDLIAHIHEGLIYVVGAWYGQHAVAVRVVEVTNPDEWRLISKASRQPWDEGATP